MIINLFSWNVNGIRAAMRKGLWEGFMKDVNPDILCVQETKTDSQKMIDEVCPTFEKNNYDIRFDSASVRKGYSGVATIGQFEISKGVSEEDSSLIDNIVVGSNLILVDVNVGIGSSKFDEEGRLLTCRYRVKSSGFEFTVLNGYYPQGGRGQDRIDYKIEFYKEVYNFAKKLRVDGQNVILCGDFNTTVGDIDLERYKENRKTTGCLPEERDALDWFLKDGFVDTFRHFHPDDRRYTFWDQKTRARDRNVGWRIDFFLVDQNILDKVVSANIHSQIMGSDHCPISIELDV